MKYIFFGSPEFASVILKHLINAELPPVAVVCNPDRPVGRDKVMTAPFTKQLVSARKQIEVFQPADTAELKAISSKLKALKPDFAIVAAYANIIPADILAIPRLGTIGVHPSLLPKYRGASPIQSVLLAGETETGVTLYQMDAKMDHGPMLSQRNIAIKDGIGHLKLEQELADLSSEMLIKLFPDILAGKIKPVDQIHTDATFTKKFITEDGAVDMITDSPETIYRKIKALNPDPGVYTLNFPAREGVRVKLLDARLNEGVLKVTEIQPAGKNPIRL